MPDSVAAQVREPSRKPRGKAAERRPAAQRACVCVLAAALAGSPPPGRAGALTPGVAPGWHRLLLVVAVLGLCPHRASRRQLGPVRDDGAPLDQGLGPELAAGSDLRVSQDLAGARDGRVQADLGAVADEAVLPVSYLAEYLDVVPELGSRAHAGAVPQLAAGAHACVGPDPTVDLDRRAAAHVRAGPDSHVVSELAAALDRRARPDYGAGSNVHVAGDVSG